MKLKTLFGKKIKIIRNNLHLTQEKFAELIGISVSTLSKMESGKKGVSFETIQNISEKLQISYSELFDFSEITKVKGIILSIETKLEKLDSSMLKNLDNFIKGLPQK